MEFALLESSEDGRYRKNRPEKEKTIPFIRKMYYNNQINLPWNRGVYLLQHRNKENTIPKGDRS